MGKTMILHAQEKCLMLIGHQKQLQNTELFWIKYGLSYVALKQRRALMG